MSLFAIEKAVYESESIRAALNLGEQGLVVVAHGQGTDLALPFITHSDRSSALILGGGQGGLIDKYLTMTAPLNTSVQLPFMLADDELNGIHPGMSLIQSWLDVRDPMNYGSLVPQQIRPTQNTYFMSLVLTTTRCRAEHRMH